MDTILYSSGLDSYLCREYLLSQGKDVQCIYYDIQSRYSKYEIQKIKELDYNVFIDRTLSLREIERQDAFIPNRNFLLSILTVSKYSDIVWIGGTKSDRVNDNNKKVFDDLSKFLSDVHQKNIKISSPFWNVYKTDVLTWFVKYRLMNNFTIDSIRTELLLNTFSCYDPLRRKKQINFKDLEFEYKTNECLKCPACFRKNVELSTINIIRDFYNDDIIKKYENEFTNCLEKNIRSEMTLNYIGRIRKKK